MQKEDNKTESKQLKTDEKFMKIALKEAKKAEQIGEVPIGAIIVKDGKIIGRGYNKKESKKNTIFHAEILAITNASKKLDSWRLEECTMYSTLEPCPMCMGAIINSRIKRLVYGANDNKSGACGSKLNLNEYNLNHKIEIKIGVCKEECSKILTDFFKGLRDEKKK